METVVSRKKAKTSVSNELEVYLKKVDMGSDEFKNYHNFKWWKEKGRHQYPILVEMIRDILTVHDGCKCEVS